VCADSVTGRVVTPKQQADDLARAVELAARVPRVQMLVWLMLRDHPGEPWQSGLAGKPSYAVFRSRAFTLDPRNARSEIDARSARHILRRAGARAALAHPDPGACRHPVRAVGVRPARDVGRARRIDAERRVGPVEVAFRAQPLVRYRLDVEIEDVHGFHVRRKLTLVPTAASPRAVNEACRR
jgi:hypothetical protein